MDAWAELQDVYLLNFFFLQSWLSNCHRKSFCYVMVKYVKTSYLWQYDPFLTRIHMFLNRELYNDLYSYSKQHKLGLQIIPLGLQITLHTLFFWKDNKWKNWLTIIIHAALKPQWLTCRLYKVELLWEKKIKIAQLNYLFLRQRHLRKQNIHDPLI